MAKQTRNTTAMPNVGNVYQGYISNSGAQAVLAGAQMMDTRQQDAARKQAADATMGQFIESMPTNVDLDKVPVSMRDTTNKYLVGLKDEFFENAKIASREGASSPLYAEAVSNMNRITMAFKNLNQDFEKLKEMKYNYINDYDKGFVSEGSRPEAVEFMTNLTTDQVPLGISESGRLTFGEGATLDDAPKYATKDFETAKSLIDLNSTLYNAGQPMDKGKEGVVRMQIRNALSKGGRDAVLSMATDDYIMPGGLGIQDQDLLYNPERTKELSQFVEDQYVAMLSQTANDGYKALIAKENRNDNRAIARSLSLAQKKKEAGLTGTSADGIEGTYETPGMTKGEVQKLRQAGRYVSQAQDELQNILSLDVEPMGTQVNTLVGTKYKGKEVTSARKIQRIQGGKTKDFLEIEYLVKTGTETSRNGSEVVRHTDVVNIDLTDPREQRMLRDQIIRYQFGSDDVSDKAILMSGDLSDRQSTLPTFEELITNSQFRP